jgi:hypothetical protein
METAADRGVVATLTEANARLVKHLEDNSDELRELKALIKKERVEKCGQRSFNPFPKGFKPKLQTLENEASAALKHFFTANDVEYQLVPPHCHRRNAAERAIRTF